MFVMIVAAGVIAGRLMGGRLWGLATLRLRAVWLVWLPVAVSLLASLPWVEAPWGPVRPLVLQANAAVGAFLLVNTLLQRAGLRIALVLMAFGWLLNWVVVLANGGMPVPRELLEGSAPTAGLYELAGMHLVPHVPISPSTALSWLGDVVRVRVSNVVIPFSLGDGMLAVGTILLIALAMRAPSTKPSPVSRDPGVLP
jgi:hypothetical protein